MVVLHSDGLDDARDRQQRRFGPERVGRTLSAAPVGASLAGEALLQAVMRHADGAAAFDDLTIVCFGRESQSSAHGPSERWMRP